MRRKKEVRSRKKSTPQLYKKQRMSGQKRLKTRLRVIVVAFLTLGIIAVALMGWITIVYPDQRGVGTGDVVAVQIVKGMPLQSLASTLASRGVVTDPWMWTLYVRLIGADKKLRNGTVLLQDSMSVRQVVQRLTVGFGSAEVRVTIPEGFTRFDIADRFERWGLCKGEEFLSATEDMDLLEQFDIQSSTAEGYLFPDTYRFNDSLGARRLAGRLLSNWQRRIESVLEKHRSGFLKLQQELGWGMQQIVVLASIVEKEAAIPTERPIIAGVFLNRLTNPDFRPKRLQADPTVAYGCLIAPQQIPSCAGFDGIKISRKMIMDTMNPYNTYRHDGLPPGPIANPGLASIRAVLVPDKHDYYYFVASGQGRHNFSKTLDDHNRAINMNRELVNEP